MYVENSCIWVRLIRLKIKENKKQGFKNSNSIRGANDIENSRTFRPTDGTRWIIKRIVAGRLKFEVWLTQMKRLGGGRTAKSSENSRTRMNIKFEVDGSRHIPIFSWLELNSDSRRTPPSSTRKFEQVKENGWDSGWDARKREKKYIRRELVGAFNDDHSAGVVDDEIFK